MKRAVSHVFVDSHPPFSDESNEFLDTPPPKKKLTWTTNIPIDERGLIFKTVMFEVHV